MISPLFSLMPRHRLANIACEPIKVFLRVDNSLLPNNGEHCSVEGFPLLQGFQSISKSVAKSQHASV